MVFLSARGLAARRRFVAFAFLLLAGLLGGCSYLGAVAEQARLQRALEQEAKLSTQKRLLDRESFFVYGLIEAQSDLSEPLSVVALSSDLSEDEVVDVCRQARLKSYYGLHLPEGEYRILAGADLDGDGLLVGGEIVAGATLRLDAERFPERVAADIDLGPEGLAIDAELRIQIPELPASEAPRAESLYYPKGTIRSLDDPIFSDQMASLGMYRPAAFMEVAPLMFYALEEDAGYKTPVIFVHGIGGSAANFAPIVDRMDRQRYAPWFFHYPSGMDLEQLSALFYDIFLSGKVMPPPQNGIAIVAHSMGGLVAREALNRASGAEGEARVALLLTIATPFGGMPAASRGVANAPVVLPAWRDLDPASEFIENLFRRGLPSELRHHAMVCARRERQLAKGRGDDGVVSLDSQLRARDSGEAVELRPIVADHAAVLSQPDAVEAIARSIAEAPNATPPEYMRRLQAGGYELPEDDARFSVLERHLLRVYGRLMRDVARGEVEPEGPFWERFVHVSQGGLPPESPPETAWIKLAAHYPELLDEQP